MSFSRSYTECCSARCRQPSVRGIRLQSDPRYRRARRQSVLYCRLALIGRWNVTVFFRAISSVPQPIHVYRAIQHRNIRLCVVQFQAMWLSGSRARPCLANSKSNELPRVFTRAHVGGSTQHANRRGGGACCCRSSCSNWTTVFGVAAVCCCLRIRPRPRLVGAQHALFHDRHIRYAGSIPRPIARSILPHLSPR